MVRVVDGYKEKVKRWRQYDTLAELARDFFKGNNIDASGRSSITIRKSTTGHEVDIYPSGFIDVNEKSYFRSALEFAKKAEEMTGIEFSLETSYQR